MPQVVNLNNTQSTLSAPNVVAITYDNDVNRADIEAFFVQWAKSYSWATLTAEYGVGPLSAGTPQHLSGNAPVAPTDGQVRGLLMQYLTGVTPAWGAPDANTIYAFFFPAGSIVDDGTGSKCCTDYDGYHSDVQIGPVDVAYSIVCQCPGFDGDNINGIPFTDMQQLTIAAGHETVEAATDPYSYNPAWAQTDDAHAVWTYVTDGELADLCETADTYAWTPPDMTYTIQRIWSNAAAAAGHDPCVGQPTEPYYQTIPDQPDDVRIDIEDSGEWSTKGTRIAKGMTGTVTLHVYADGQAGPFVISVDDYSYAYLGGSKFLEISTPPTPVNPGDSVQAMVTVMGQDPSLGGDAEAFVVTTAPVSGGGPSTYFFGLIGQ